VGEGVGGEVWDCGGAGEGGVARSLCFFVCALVCFCGGVRFLSAWERVD
jgi:hypothetical protein